MTENLNEWADIYAAMSEIDDEQEDAKATKPVQTMFGASRSVPVAHDGSQIEAATLAYVQQLERALTKQQMEIRKLERMVKTLGYMLRQHRGVVNSHGNHMNDLRREVDNKLDRRDF